jgi:hypothetical protein
MIEGYFWENRDPHKIAIDWGKGNDPMQNGGFQSPAGQRAAEIGERLAIKDVSKATQCIGCHSVSIENVPKQNFDKPLADGVTCVACHGAYQDWGPLHQLTGDTPWKRKTRLEKWVDYGMVDLWDPVVRAQTCMSCHIGDSNPESGKSITHAIYAAGHPPLPSIEVTAFSEEQPQHWLYLRCKNDKARGRLEFNAERLEQTEQVAASGLVALGRMMELIEADINAPKDKTVWPEFARFDCGACHHELKASEAQPLLHRGFRGGTGRPPAPAWPMALVRLGIDAADPLLAESRGSELDRLISEFRTALADRPFGHPGRTAKAARAIVLCLQAPLAELSQLAAIKPGEKRRVLSADEALRLLIRLTETAGMDFQDYESARQIGWACRTIVYELWEVIPARPRGNKALEVVAANQPRIQEILKGLDADLVLSLRERGKLALGACPAPTQIMDFPTTSDQKPIVGPVLGGRLEKLSNYNPEVFRTRVQELSRLLHGP